MTGPHPTVQTQSIEDAETGTATGSPRKCQQKTKKWDGKGKRISQARSIPSKESTIHRKRHRKSRNCKQPHHSGFHQMYNHSRGNKAAALQCLFVFFFHHPNENTFSRLRRHIPHLYVLFIVWRFIAGWFLATRLEPCCWKKGT